MAVRYSHYRFAHSNYGEKLEARFWCSNSCSIAIIASITYGVDWAAYIGSDNSQAEDDTLQYVSRWGNKLSEKDARYFFPEIELPYRN